MENIRQQFIDQFFFNNKSIALFDGAMGTQCEAFGADVNQELWSTKTLLENPEIIQKVHTSYLEAGAEMIGTNTYQLSPETCARYFSNDNNEKNSHKKKMSVAQVVDFAVSVANESWKQYLEKKGGKTNQKKRILGCVGSIGSSLPNALEFTGAYPEECLTPQYMADFHTERLSALVSNKNVDAILIETMPRLDEVLFMLELLETKIFPSCQRIVPVIVSFSGRKQEKPQESFTSGSGDEVGDAFSRISQKPFVCGVGVNCCAPSVVEGAFKRYLETIFSNNNNNPVCPVFIGYPNSGEVFDGSDGTWHIASKNSTELDHVSNLGKWFEQSEMKKQLEEIPKMIIGGCCRTTPQDIANLREAVGEVEE